MAMDVREKLVELLKSVLPNFRNNMAYWGEKPIYEFADCLLAHGVTVQERGRWECQKPCPVCGENRFKGLDADIWADWEPPYCPNCGAKMDEVSE